MFSDLKRPSGAISEIRKFSHFWNCSAQLFQNQVKCIPWLWNLTADLSGFSWNSLCKWALNDRKQERRRKYLTLYSNIDSKKPSTWQKLNPRTLDYEPWALLLCRSRCPIMLRFIDSSALSCSGLIVLIQRWDTKNYNTCSWFFTKMFRRPFSKKVPPPSYFDTFKILYFVDTAAEENFLWKSGSFFFCPEFQWLCCKSDFRHLSPNFKKIGSNKVMASERKNVFVPILWFCWVRTFLQCDIDCIADWQQMWSTITISCERQNDW